METKPETILHVEWSDGKTEDLKVESSGEACVEREFPDGFKGEVSVTGIGIESMTNIDCIASENLDVDDHLKPWSIDMRDCVSLKELDWHNPYAESILLPATSSVKKIELSGYGENDGVIHDSCPLDVTGLPNLEELILQNSCVRSLDLSNNAKLKKLDIEDSDYITWIPATHNEAGGLTPKSV